MNSEMNCTNTVGCMQDSKKVIVGLVTLMDMLVMNMLDLKQYTEDTVLEYCKEFLSLQEQNIW